MGGACNIAGSQSFYSYAAGSWSSKVPKNMQVLILYYSQDKTRQDVGCIFRSGNAEWREAMQRIVDRNDAKPERKMRPQMLCFSLRRVLLVAGSFAAIHLPARSLATLADKGFIDAILGHQLFMGAPLDDLAVVDHQDLVGVLHGL